MFCSKFRIKKESFFLITIRMQKRLKCIFTDYNSILRHEMGKWYLQNRGDDYKNEVSFYKSEIL
ncbi:hypothetical protein C0J52_19426 [Blattella germanica]|nr:hypothetical protein C0J52_19426 [Blattella germanica]